MTDLRNLLHDAAPETAPLDLDSVRSRAHARGRRRRALTAAAMTAVAIALIGGLITLAMSGADERSTGLVTKPDRSARHDTLCGEVVRQGRLRAADITDPAAIADLVRALPPERRLDAALFYYPYGGPIPYGTDTSGLAAQAAGERLNELYKESCNYTGPTDRRSSTR